MHHNLIALYAGPDQAMTVTSGIASVIGVLLIFWHKVVAAFVRLFGKAPRPANASTQQTTPKESS